MTRQILILLMCLAGCSRDGLIEVSGHVALDGVALGKGTICFCPVDGKGPTAGTIIKHGKYSVEVAPGPKKVEILGYKKIGQEYLAPNDPSSPLIDVNEQIVPERYNRNTELLVDLSFDGDNQFRFELESRNSNK